jgi:predicted metal-dependent HD superfamily phosphohydrolase
MTIRTLSDASCALGYESDPLDDYKTDSLEEHYKGRVWPDLTRVNRIVEEINAHGDLDYQAKGLTVIAAWFRDFHLNRVDLSSSVALGFLEQRRFEKEDILQVTTMILSTSWQSVEPERELEKVFHDIERKYLSDPLPEYNFYVAKLEIQSLASGREPAVFNRERRNLIELILSTPIYYTGIYKHALEKVARENLKRELDWRTPRRSWF